MPSSHTIGNANFNGYLEKWNSEPYYDLDLTKAKELFTASGATVGHDRQVAVPERSQERADGSGHPVAAERDRDHRRDQRSGAALYTISSKYDPTAWDLLLDATAGGDQVYSPWALLYAADRYNGTTSNWFDDPELQALLAAASADGGQTEANLDAFVTYDREHVYALGLLSWQNNVVSVSGVTKIFTDKRGQIIPGACEYAADFK